MHPSATITAPTCAASAIAWKAPSAATASARRIASPIWRTKPPAASIRTAPLKSNVPEEVNAPADVANVIHDNTKTNTFMAITANATTSPANDTTANCAAVPITESATAENAVVRRVGTVRIAPVKNRMPPVTCRVSRTERSVPVTESASAASANANRQRTADTRASFARSVQLVRTDARSSGTVCSVSSIKLDR